jgi:hypothetical protein
MDTFTMCQILERCQNRKQVDVVDEFEIFNDGKNMTIRLEIWTM